MSKSFNLQDWLDGKPDPFSFNPSSRKTSELLVMLFSPTQLEREIVENDEVPMPEDVFKNRGLIVLNAVVAEIDSRIPIPDRGD